MSVVSSTRNCLGTWGHLGFLIWTLLMVGFMPAGRLPWLAAIILLFALLNRISIWPMLTNWRLWAMLLPIVVISPFILGEPDTKVWILQLSSQGFWAGIWMALRALCITMAFGATFGALSVSQLSSLFETFGLKGVGFALGVALNMVTLLGEVVSVTYHTCRLRGGFRRNVFSNAQRFLIGTITSALQHGDNVVLAAAARAFDPERRTAPTGISITRADAILLILLAGLSIPLL